MTPTPAPEGFKLRHLGDGFMKTNGPIYYRRDGDQLVLGFRVEERHCNPLGWCHGGMLATLADMVCAVCAHVGSEAAKNRFLPTINLQVDYVASARLGDWVQGQATVIKATRSMIFMQGMLMAGEGHSLEPVARISGIFKIGPAFDPATGQTVPATPKAQP
ncbi:MAG: hypothetical protein RLZZ126_560 [Pseudomonadota bacterium]|jgi:uncharacterized protein (TIGR00369 family)